MIDINAYAGPWPFRALPASAPSEVADVLQAAGIARALVSPLEALFFEDPRVANERLAARLQPEGTLLLCAVVNPRLANWRPVLTTARESLGARAIKLHPGYHLYELDSPAARECLAAAGEAGLPVIIQLRMQDARAQHPLCRIPDVPAAAALEAARSAPGAQVVLGGIRFAEARGQGDAIRALANVWVDLSQVEYVDGMRQVIQAVGSDRLLLGTHAPLFNVRSALLKLDEGLLSDAERAAITRENARRLLRV
ncbi:MAG: amidohydrolase family protein [Armatimonadetes bacterium]|nr:amidohydrolase family protein [Armatimonadota bacterium]